MAKNKFGIPEDVLSEIRTRDTLCVYCHKLMMYPYLAQNCANCATIEHLHYNGPLNWRDGLQAHDIVICCGSCNSSRGPQQLHDWFNKQYCIERNISANTVAAPVRNYLQRQKEKQLAVVFASDAAEQRHESD